MAGVTPVAATTSLGGDLRALVDAIVAGSGGADIVFITSPGRAVAARVLSNDATLPIYGSAAVAGTQLIAVDVAAFFFSIVPEIRTSTMSTLHMDTVPLPIVFGHGAVAGPVRDLFQTGSIAFATELTAGWAIPAGLVQTINNPAW